MADEAVIRIITQGQANTTSTPAQTTSGQPPLIGSDTPSALERRQTKEIVEAIKSLKELHQKEVTIQEKQSKLFHSVWKSDSSGFQGGSSLFQAIKDIWKSDSTSRTGKDSASVVIEKMRQIDYLKDISSNSKESNTYLSNLSDNSDKHREKFDEYFQQSFLAADDTIDLLKRSHEQLVDINLNVAHMLAIDPNRKKPYRETGEAGDLPLKEVLDKMDPFLKKMNQWKPEGAESTETGRGLGLEATGGGELGGRTARKDEELAQELGIDKSMPEEQDVDIVRKRRAKQKINKIGDLQGTGYEEPEPGTPYANRNLLEDTSTGLPGWIEKFLDLMPEMLVPQEEQSSQSDTTLHLPEQEVVPDTRLPPQEEIAPFHFEEPEEPDPHIPPVLLPDASDADKQDLTSDTDIPGTSPERVLPEDESFYMNLAENPRWENWKPPHHGSGWNMLGKRELAELREVGLSPIGGRTIDEDIYGEMVRLRKERGFGPPSFAQGGEVNHPGQPNGTDTVPAWLTEGEFVVNRKDAQDNRSILEEINNGTKGMALGGLVRGVGSAAKGATMGALGGAKMAADASSDPGSTISSLGSAASSAGQALSKFMPMAGAVVQAGGQIAQSFGALMGEIDKTVERYGQYSPQIAQAKAISEIRQTMGDFKRAQEAGNELADYVLAKSDMEQKFEEIKIKLLVQLVPVVTAILEDIEMIMSSGEGVENAILKLFAPLTVLSDTAGELVEVQKDKKLVIDPAAMLLNEDSPLAHTEGRGGGTVPRI